MGITAGNRKRLMLAAAVGVLGMDATARAQATRPAAAEFSTMSLEDLMNVQVTSVSKTEQSVATAPAAISVISGEDIRRSGMQSIPDLLRLSPGLDVARVNNNQWAISSRGFNSLYANKLLVLVDGRT